MFAGMGEVLRGHCQRKIACAARGLILASLDEKPIPLFQQFARGNSPHSDGH